MNTFFEFFDRIRCVDGDDLLGNYWSIVYTLIRDEVRYALPLVMAGPVRGLVHALYIRPKLERIFDFRGQVFNRLFDGSQQTVATATSALSPTGEGA